MENKITEGKEKKLGYLGKKERKEKGKKEEAFLRRRSLEPSFYTQRRVRKL